VAPDRSKAGGNRNRPDVLTDPRAIQRVHLDHHQISSHQNVVKTIQDTPITDLQDVEVDKTSDDFAAGQSLVWSGDSWIAGDPEVLIPVKAAEEMTKGTPVYVSDEQVSGKPIVSKADSDGTDTYPAIGLLLTDLASGAEGHAVGGGILSGLDTSGYTAGDALYLSSTPGVLTNTRPEATAEKVQKVAVVARSHAEAGTVIVMGAGRTNDIPNDLVTLTGVALGDSDLGTFAAAHSYPSTIADNETVKGALQDLSDEANRLNTRFLDLAGDLAAFEQEVVDSTYSYRGRYDTEAETSRAVNDAAAVKVELYYTARPDGDGLAENEQSDAGVPGTSTVERRLYFSDKFDADVNTAADWTAYTTQPADDETFANAKASLLAGLSDTDGTANTRGTLPVSLKLERQVTTELLVEDYPGAEVAWSVRKVSGVYTGYCMKVRRASDNTEQDIGFDTDGNLDTDAIETFCTTNDGFVSVWYDQSGDGHDLTQTTAANQPQIYDGTAQEVLKVFDRPSIRFDDTPTYLIQGTQAIINTSGGYAFSVVGVNPDATNQAFGVLGSNTSVVVAGLARDGNVGANQIGMSVGGYHVNGTQITSSNQDKLYDATETQGIVHIANYGNTSGTDRNYWPTYPHLTFYANAQMQEFVAWHTDQSSNQSDIEDDMDTYYGVSTRELLDTYSGAIAAYSVRRLKQFYTGSCMKVRRASDDVELDIGFDSNGDLDTAAIASHCGSANGYVVTWYDQSGNGRDATASSDALEPMIYNGTAVVTGGTKPALDAANTEGTYGSLDITIPVSWQSQPFSTFVVKNGNATSSAQAFWWSASGGGPFFDEFHSSHSLGPSVRLRCGTNLFHSAVQPAYALYSTLADGTGSLIRTNGSQVATGDAGNSSLSSPLALFSRPGSSEGAYKGKLQEVVFYGSDESANFSGIESNINTYYSVY